MAIANMTCRSTVFDIIELKLHHIESTLPSANVFELVYWPAVSYQKTKDRVNSGTDLVKRVAF